MRGELRILDRSGHTTIDFDTEVDNGPLDPEVAKKEFDRLVSEGHLGFGTTKEGKSEQLKKFDSSFPIVTISPPFVGG